jgi:hypothetical protein
MPASWGAPLSAFGRYDPKTNFFEMHGPVISTGCKVVAVRRKRISFGYLAYLERLDFIPQTLRHNLNRQPIPIQTHGAVNRVHRTLFRQLAVLFPPSDWVTGHTDIFFTVWKVDYI